jgi:hypothetical protein
VFNYNGNYCTAKKRLIDQANKALYALYYKLRNLTIPIDLQLKLFDCLILKKICNLRKNTSNYKVYGEMGNPKWIKYIKSIFDEIGLSFIWNDQIHIKKDLLKSIVKQKLFGQFI